MLQMLLVTTTAKERDVVQKEMYWVVYVYAYMHLPMKFDHYCRFYLVCLQWKQFSSVQLLSHVRLFVIPWTAACQASLSITNSQSLLKFMSIESMMPSSHLILCHPLLFMLSIFPSISVFSNESVLRIMWPKYWSSVSTSILPMNT